MSKTNGAVKFIGRKVFVGDVRVGTITGGRYHWRGEAHGGFGFQTCEGYESTLQTKNGEFPWAYFNDIKRAVMAAVERGNIKPVTAL